MLKGWSPSALLDTYEAERLPVARLMMAQTTRTLLSSTPDSNARREHSAAPRPMASRPQARPELYREHGLIYGVTYDSTLIVPDGTPPIQVANPVTDYFPNARPGGRAPHVWLERNGALISTLDLFGREFVLLAGAEGHSWCNAAQETSHRLGVPLQSLRIGHGGDLDDPSGVWAERYGIDADGAVLVRPDGYVAWRGAKSKPESAEELEIAWNTALGRRSLRQLVPVS